MEEEITLCNMVIKSGGNNGAMPADATRYKYLGVYNYHLNASSRTLALFFLKQHF
jgi:homoaconitase/3-isopropylmalate dehydratase large subunit